MRLVTTFIVAVAAFGALPVQAATFTNWSQYGQSALISGGSAVRLVSDGASQSGAAWAPGSIDMGSIMANTANYTEILFSFRLSGAGAASTFGDGLSLMLGSGAVPAFQAGFLGLGQFDDGIAFVADPAAGKAASLQVGSVANAGTILNAGSTVSGLNMLDARQVDAKLRLSYSATYNAWVMSLKMRDSGATSLWKQVAFAQLGSGAFASPADVRVGFGASTSAAEHANIDLIAFQANAMTVPTSPVPEPATAAFGAVGLALLARARQPARRRGARAAS